MKSYKTILFLISGIPLLILIFIMAKADISPITFKSNSKLKSFSQYISPDSIGIEKVPYMDLMRMMAKYRDERQAIINEHFSGTGSGKYGEGFEDSRYYYISLEVLENYIAYIKQQVTANNINVEFSGIRIYPIVYPNTGSNAYFSSIPSIYRNHQSIVFTPTYMNESGYAIDFDPDIYIENPNGSGNVPRSLEKSQDSSTASFLAATFGGVAHGSLSAQDHVWLCPPPLCAHASALSNSDNICPDHNACPY